MNENSYKENKGSFIIGRNAVTEALKGSRDIDRLYIQNVENKSAMGKIIALAKDKGIPIKEVSAQKLAEMADGEIHQGVIASCSAKNFSTLEEVFEMLNGESPFFIIADELEDPHNLGAIIRTAEAAGANAVIIPKRRGVGLTATVARTSAGAIEYMPVVRVTNIVDTIKQLKEKNIWIYGADMDGENWCQTDFSGGVALVIGSEGKGISRLVRENCDVIVSLPMCGNINSLNASVAAGILMYEVTRQRLAIKAKNPK